jgi:large subunit ribosomal protein L18
MRYEEKKKRLTKKIKFHSNRMRLIVHRTNHHIYSQVVDDEKGKTMVTFGSHAIEQKELRGKTKTEVAKIVGENIAQLAIGKKIKKVVFDRSGYKYHGRVKALADAAREKGLEF